MTFYLHSGFSLVASYAHVPHLNGVLFCCDYQYYFKTCSNTTRLWVTLHVYENVSKYRKCPLNTLHFTPVQRESNRVMA